MILSHPGGHELGVRHGSSDTHDGAMSGASHLVEAEHRPAIVTGELKGLLLVSDRHGALHTQPITALGAPLGARHDARLGGAEPFGRLRRRTGFGT